MFQEGLGVVASVDQAADWYSKAVHDGYSAAAVSLRNLQR
jgi:TPR repeat protein